MQTIHEKFQLSTEKVRRVITDNASNFAKAFRKFGLQVVQDEEVGEDFFLDVDDDEDDDDEANDIESDDDEELDRNQSDESNDVNFIPFPDDPENIYELPKQERCFSHTLSLVCTTDLKKTKFSRFHQTMFTRAMKKASMLWNNSSSKGSVGLASATNADCRCCYSKEMGHCIYTVSSP